MKGTRNRQTKKNILFFFLNVKKNLLDNIYHQTEMYEQ